MSSKNPFLTLASWLSHLSRTFYCRCELNKSIKTKFLLLTSVLSLICFSDYAQTGPIKIRSIDVMGGVTKNGRVLSLGYIQTLSKRLYAKSQFLYGHARESEVARINNFGINLYCSYTLIEYKQTVSFNAIAGIVTYYTSTITDNFGRTKGITYGGLAGFEIATRLNDDFCFIVTGAQQQMLKYQYQGNFWYLEQIGFRYKIPAQRKKA